MIIYELGKNACTYAYDVQEEECKWIKHTGREDEKYVAVAHVERYRRVDNKADSWHYPWDDFGCDALLFAKDMDEEYAIETKDGDRYYFRKGMICYVGHE